MRSFLQYDVSKACICLSFLCSTVQAGAQDCNKYPMHLTNNIIVNPSFEPKPDTCWNFILNNNNLKVSDVVPGWQMGITFGQTWFFGECNHFVVEPPLPVFPKIPQPIPDGKGVLMFTDHEGGGRSPAKTYLSNCLANPLLKNYPYTLKFFIGFGATNDYFDTITKYAPQKPFRKKTGKPPATVTLYGHASCGAAPAVSPPTGPYDCLTTYKQGWVELGTVTVTGDSGTWGEGVISFVPPANINVIAIGPACGSKNAHSQFTEDYYAIDHLRLYKSTVIKPYIDISGSLCDDEGDLSKVTLQALSTVSGLPNKKFTWYKNNVIISNLQTDNMLVVQKNKQGPGWYQCRVEDDSMCARTDSVYIDWLPSPSDKVLGPDTTMCTGDVISLNATTQDATYLWDNGSTLPTRSVNQGGTYSVTISNTCRTVTATRKIIVNDCLTGVILPSAFTPNRDGLNDVLAPAIRLPVKRFRFSVYNRMGQRIFTSTTPGAGWDGTVNRIQQPGGTYIWLVDYIDTDGIPRTKKGTVVLIR